MTIKTYEYNLQSAVSNAINASPTAGLGDDTMINLGIRDVMQGIARHGHNMILLALLLLLLLLHVGITTINSVIC